MTRALFRALLEEGSRRDDDRKLFANIEGQAWDLVLQSERSR
jgi:hypothetical protein